jgi:uncharacterized SAM-binding protein YcdF (DUF218 family)
MGKRLAAATGLLVGLLLIWLSILAWQIVAAGETASARPADAAIVLGAAVCGERPSPVFEERIRHGVHLHRQGVVKWLVFTGGYGAGARSAESAVARSYAIRRGVPAGAILTETRSRTTRQNLVEARRLMRARRLRTALIVTDPLHMKRALRMSAGLGMEAWPSPTPTSRYRTWRSKTGFLLRELYFYHWYLLTGQ